MESPRMDWRVALKPRNSLTWVRIASFVTEDCARKFFDVTLRHGAGKVGARIALYHGKIQVEEKDLGELPQPAAASRADALDLS